MASGGGPQDADEATSALIAQLLQQDQMAAGNPYFEPDHDGRRGKSSRDAEDDEFEPPVGLRKKRERAPRAQPAPKPKKKSKPTDGAEDDAVDDKNNAGLYTEEEEKKFREGLALYGRDWGKVCEHIGTRDKLSVRSHAQKHFINLLKAGEALPPKVAETGPGFTLSGKPLNLESGSVKPYIKGVLSSPAVMNHLSELIASGAIISVPVIVEAKKSATEDKGTKKKEEKSTPMKSPEEKTVSAASLPVTTAPPKAAVSSSASATPSPTITPSNSTSLNAAPVSVSQSSSRAASAAGTPTNTPASTNPSTPVAVPARELSPERTDKPVGSSSSPSSALPSQPQKPVASAPAASTSSSAPSAASSSSASSASASSSHKRALSSVDISAALASAAALTQKLTSAPTTEIRVVRKPRKKKDEEENDDPEVSFNQPEKETPTRAPRQPRQQRATQSDDSEEESPLTATGRTEYSKMRLRENSGKIPSSSISAAHIDANTNPLTMVKCESLGTESAPFRLRVHSTVLLLMDLHAHLSTAEIIGFLGGKWDSQNKVIEILAAFPCRAMEAGEHNSEHDGMNVEMAPESELKVREEIQQRNMKVVGWYHSHPVFQPDPSLRDIENQRNYQNLFRDVESKMDPFIGLIICPYDIRMPTDISLVNNFLVRPSVQSNGFQVPFSLALEQISDGQTIEKEVLEKKDELIEYYSTHTHRVDMSEIWRMCLPINPHLPPASSSNTSSSSTSTSAATPKVQINPTSRLQKLCASLRGRLPASDETNVFLQSLCDTITKKWK